MSDIRRRKLASPHKKSRRHYLLIEVLISMTLVSLCLPALLSTSTECLIATREQLQRLALRREADQLFWAVQADLYARDISWNAMDHGPIRLKTHTLSFPDGAITLLGGRIKPYGAEGVMRVSAHWTKSQRAIYRLIDVELTLTPENSAPQRFVYQIFVERVIIHANRETV